MGDSDTFSPDWTSPPGETVVDILKERSISLDEFARRMGDTLGQARELIDGRAELSAQIAGRLELILGVPARFWISREMQYREGLARIRRAAPPQVDRQWLTELPVADMMKFGWIPKVASIGDQMEACLRFFDVADVSEWRETQRSTLEASAFRTSPSFASQRGAVSAWLRQGEIQSSELVCQPWSAKRFEEAIPLIRPLTRKHDPSRFVPELMDICAQFGVAVAIVRAPTGCRASGATRFLSANRALLLLSFRYLSDDHFWFTFFHEAGHLLLHGERAVFLEGFDKSSTAEEEQANEFAANALIPRQFRTDFMGLRNEAREVIKFSQFVGVSPGIVVGQLQHCGVIRPNQLNSLKRRFQWE